MSRGDDRWRRWLRDGQTVCALVAAKTAVRLLGFRRLVWFLERRATAPERSGGERLAAIKAVHGAVFRMDRRWRLHSTCLSRAIAAQALLRRRGVNTTFCYGVVTLPDRGLCAHAWLVDGEMPVIGIRPVVAEGYHVLAQFPRDGFPLMEKEVP